MWGKNNRFWNYTIFGVWATDEEIKKALPWVGGIFIVILVIFFIVNRCEDKKSQDMVKQQTIEKVKNGQ